MLHMFISFFVDAGTGEWSEDIIVSCCNNWVMRVDHSSLFSFLPQVYAYLIIYIYITIYIYIYTYRRTNPTASRKDRTQGRLDLSGSGLRRRVSLDRRNV
jgi:hypothetical protein